MQAILTEGIMASESREESHPYRNAVITVVALAILGVSSRNGQKLSAKAWSPAGTTLGEALSPQHGRRDCPN